MKSTYTYFFNFNPDNEKHNFRELDKLSSMVFGGKGSVENVERLFDITFAAGIENCKPVFLNLDGEDCKDDYLLNKYDGLVLLTTSPLDHKTNKPFAKTKLTFKVEEKDIDNGFVEIKGYINSKFRNSLKF